MDWEKEIELPIGIGNGVWLTVAEVVVMLLGQLDKDEIEAVGSELIEAAVTEPIEAGED